MDQRTIVIAKLLHERTKQGKVTWASVADKTFEADIDELSVRIRVMPSDRVRLVVYNSEGDSIDWIDSSNAELHDMLMNLFQLARRRALKIDESLDALVNKLKD